MSLLKNYTFDEIEIGQSEQIFKQLQQDDITAFAILTGDVNPAHLDKEYAENSMFGKIIAHGMWGGSMFSTVLGTKLPGPGTIYLEQNLKFLKPVAIDDTLTIAVTVIDKQEKNKIVTFSCDCTNQDGKTVITGQAKVIAPSESIERQACEVGKLQIVAPKT